MMHLNYIRSRQTLSAELASHVQAYLDSGNEITEIPIGCIAENHALFGRLNHQASDELGRKIGALRTRGSTWAQVAQAMGRPAIDCCRLHDAHVKRQNDAQK